MVERTYRTWIEPEAAAAQPTLGQAVRQAPSPADMDDAALIERMCASRNGSEIRDLLDGSLAAHGGNHSAADMALCNHLAFWRAGDEGRMDRIFRSSGLMRNKLDSRRGDTTYGRQTIERAATNAAEFYRPRGGSGSSRDRNTNACSTMTRREAQGVGSVTADEAQGTYRFDAAPSVEGWMVDDRGRLWTVDREGEPRHSVTSTAP